MTAVIGIRTNKGIESVVIGTDTQMSSSKEGGDPDIFESKKNVRKIVYGENWIISLAGATGEEVYRFYKKLGGSKRYGSSDEIVNEMILEAVKRYDEWRKNPKREGIHFKEFVDLNATLMRKKNFALEETTEGILGVYSKESGVRLFHLDEFGNLKEPSEMGEAREFDYESIGSGSGSVKKYIKDIVDEEESEQFPVDTRRAIRIARESIRRAGRELHTGGMDLAVLTANGVEYYGLEIKEALREAEDKKFEEIESRYVDSEEE